MRAIQYHGVGEPLRLNDVPRPRPSAGEAIVAVRSVGLCGSDVHIAEGHTATAFTPLTLGHEISGVVDEIADDVSGLSVGDPVFVNPMIGCRHCVACRTGDDSSCPKRQTLGIHRHGGLADYVLVPARNLTRVAEGVSFAEIALVESAGTANRALRLVDAGEHSDILVVGAGGLGLPTVRLARARGSRVVTVDIDPVARQRSIDAGAAASFDPRAADGLAIMSSSSDGLGFTGAIDCVGAPATVALALESLGHLGRCALVGIGSTAPALTPPAHFVRRGLQVSGAYGYAEQDIADVLTRVLDGSVDLTPSISATAPLEAAPMALDQFARRHNSPTRIIIEVS